MKNSFDYTPKEWANLTVRERHEIIGKEEGYSQEEINDLIQQAEEKEMRKKKSNWHCCIPAWYEDSSGGMIYFWINSDNKTESDERHDQELIIEALEELLKTIKNGGNKNVSWTR